MTYALLEEFPEDADLPQRPVQVWILLTFEIPIRTERGTFLIARQPYYSDARNGNAEFTGAWAPPFTGIPVPHGFDLPGTPRALRQRIEAVEATAPLLSMVEQSLYEMGVDNPTIAELPGFTELKNSPRTPSLLKAYRIKRYRVTSTLSSSKSNLADPDGRKGFVFLPLEDIQTFYRQESLEDRGPRWRFLGLPLMTNLATLLSRRADVASLIDSAVTIEHKYFFHEQVSTVISFDLSGYGRALEFVRNNMATLRDSEDLSLFFTRTLAEWFGEFLCRVSARQVQHAGDGFICALDDGQSPDLPDLVSALRRLHDNIDSINRRLATDVRMGSRCAIHRGTYRYGRVAGPLSGVPGFDGETIVTVARMEQGLGQHLRDLGHSGALHALVTSFDDILEDEAFDTAHWEASEQVQLTSKEWASQTRVFLRRR